MQLPRSSSLFPYTTLFRSRISPSAVPRVQPRQIVYFSVCTFSRPMDFIFAAPHSSALHSAGEPVTRPPRSEEHTSELQSPDHLVCRLLLEQNKRSSSSPAC